MATLVTTAASLQTSPSHCFGLQEIVSRSTNKMTSPDTPLKCSRSCFSRLRFRPPTSGYGNRDSSVCTATGYGARFPAEARDTCLLHSVHTESAAHPASYPMGTVAISPLVKRPGREADLSPLFSVDVKNGGNIHPLPHTPSWLSAQLIKHRDNFTFPYIRVQVLSQAVTSRNQCNTDACTGPCNQADWSPGNFQPNSNSLLNNEPQTEVLLRPKDQSVPG
jgi:hypothetical protein